MQRQSRDSVTEKIIRELSEEESYEGGHLALDLTIFILCMLGFHTGVFTRGKANLMMKYCYHGGMPTPPPPREIFKISETVF